MSLRFSIGSLAALVLFSAAAAQPITFESDAEILVVRVHELMPGMAVADIIGPRNGTVLCIAMDSEGKPIATTTAFVEVGNAMFANLAASDVATVACRYN